jgi:putative FmdB family regulatory protein
MQGWNGMTFLSNTEVLMPIYTYQCNNCGVRFERQQSFSEAPLTRCPECSKKSLRKIYTPVGIVFKGSGFYSTDHRSPSGSNRSKESPKPEPDDKATKKTEPAKSESSDSG